jgi:hypothetical protein
MTCSNVRRFGGVKDPELCGYNTEIKIPPTSSRKLVREKEETKLKKFVTLKEPSITTLLTLKPPLFNTFKTCLILRIPSLQQKQVFNSAYFDF